MTGSPLTGSPGLVADCVTGYSARLQAVIGAGHHVASPLAAWLLLALAAPASSGTDRARLTEVLGCDADTAARAAADLLAQPHPVVASAAALWTSSGTEFGAGFEQWRAGLPPQVTTGELPGQAGLDWWVREHTFGLIDQFPIQDGSLDLVFASALATKVSWRVPFELAPAAGLGSASLWARQLSQVLRTPPGGGHAQYIAVTPDAGDVIVHAASAVGGVLVVSVAAGSDVPAGTVLSAAHQIGIRLATGSRVDRRDLAAIPLGVGPLWGAGVVTAAADSCIALLPAWSATSQHDLSDPSLGFPAAKNAIAAVAGPWQARQSAMARYTRTGFTAAAATAMAVTLAMRPQATRREVQLRFGHPYAVVAFTTDPGDGTSGLWQGLPVFSAWISNPEDAPGDATHDTDMPDSQR
jgi:hypothetical protein